MATIKLRSSFGQAPPWMADALALAALLASVIVFLWKLALTNLILARGDMFLYFYPYWSYSAETVRQGRIPFWNPYLFMGAPFLANSQAGVLYPLNLALAWLPTLRAINLTIILHLGLAGAGAYVLARRSLGMRPLAAWLGAATFALGGYLGAQVAHVNQLQALAWMPLALAFFDLALERWRLMFALAGVLAIQFLAGHTQSVFITLVGLGVYALWPTLENAVARRWNGRDLARRLGILAGAAILGGLLSAAQLAPTLELTRESLRAGGLSWREAVSFSLNPLRLWESLLPNYRQAIYSEYAAFIGVIGLALMVTGVWASFRANRTTIQPGLTAEHLVSRRSMAVLAFVGLFLALGGYNPVYSVLVKVAPGFNLFRVPARWLVLYALGAAMLAGIGLAHVSDRLRSRARFGLAALLIAELFIASRPLDYDHPTVPDALTDLRPPVAHLLAASAELPAFRFLSISPIQFDPGDSAELASIFADQLAPDAFYDLLIATKQKEIIAPNLPLYYRLSAADGYDGGVLPLRNYARFQSLFVPPDKVSPDGRLRENLSDVPDVKWLSLMNIRYVITDKTLDAWLDDVFYDLQFTTPLGPSAGQEASVAYAPHFEATALGLVSFLQDATSLPDDTPVAQVSLGFADGLTQTFTLRAGVDTAQGLYTGGVAHRPARAGGHFVRDHPEITDYVTRLRFDKPRTVTSVVVRPLLQQGQLVMRGASLIDEQTGGFQSLVISGRGRFRLVHSGDVKIYENLDVLPRALVVPTARAFADDATALAAMKDATFDPAKIVVMNGTPDPTKQNDASGALGEASIMQYEPERVIVETNSPGQAWLVLADAWYPGWRAQVDGRPADLMRADMLFRAVPVPAGRHWVEIIYDPASFRTGVVISMAAMIGCIAILWLWPFKSQSNKPR
jgi:Bacterial membrane protein YfhO